MLTVLQVKLGLLPVALFFALTAAGAPGAAGVAAFLLSLALLAWRIRSRQLMQIEVAVAAYLGLIVVVGVIGGYGRPGMWVAGMHALLALVSVASLWYGRPWTAEYARSSYAAESVTPTFQLVNRVLTTLWGAVFALLAMLQLVQAPGIVTATLVGISLFLSILGPRFLIRRFAARLLKTERFEWPAPPILPARGNVDVDVAVVGAGIGGLTTAALLAAAGARVAVLEQHSVPGGYAHSFLRKAHHEGKPVVFRFDAGVHDVSGVRQGGVVSTLMAKVGAAPLDWARLDHRYVIDRRIFDVPREPDRHARQLGALFPNSAEGISALFVDIRAVFDAMYSEAAACSGVPGRPSDLDTLLAFPKRYPLATAWLDRSFIDFVRRRVTDAEAIRFIMGLAGYVGDGAASVPVRTMVPLFGYAFFGGYYPRGGSSRIAEVLGDVIEDQGGVVRLKSPVKRIIVECGEARGLALQDGQVVRAGAVVSNADFRRTYLELVGPEHLDPAFQSEVEAVRPACSAVAVHLGLRSKPEGPPVVHVMHEGRKLGLVIPSLVDDTAAPAGFATMELMCLVPHAEATSWFSNGNDLATTRRSNGYRSRKQAAGAELVALAAEVFPGLAGDIIHRSVASPVTYARYDHTTAGAIYGMEGFEGRGARSPIRHLLIAGSATHGAGIEAVMISGARAAEALLPGLLASPNMP